MINLFPIHHVIKFSILKEMGITYNAPTFEFHLLYKFASKYQGDQDVRGISIKCREFCMSQYIYIYISLYYPYGCCVGGEIWNFLFYFNVGSLLSHRGPLEGLQRRSTKTNHILHGAWRMVLPGKQLKNNA